MGAATYAVLTYFNRLFLRWILFFTYLWFTYWLLYFNEFWWYVSRCIHHYSPGVIASPTEIYNFMVFMTNFLCLHNFWCVMHYCLLCNASLVVKSICQRQRNGPKSKLQSALHLRNSHFWNFKLRYWQILL